MSLAKVPLIFIGGFIAGVALRSFFPTTSYLVVRPLSSSVFASFGSVPVLPAFLFVLALALFLVWLIKRKQPMLLVSFVLFASVLGVVRMDIANINNGDLLLEERVGAEIVIEGLVVDEPDARESHVNLTVQLQSFFENEKEHAIDSKALVTADMFPEYKYGDTIRLSGVLKKPKNFLNEENGKEFDYVSFLGKDGIFYQMLFPKTELISQGGGNIVKRWLFTLKRGFIENISRVIPEPQASLLGGLVVGAKQSLGKDLLDDFRTTGLIHIVVLSGYNVTIIAESLMRFFSFLPRLFSLWVGGFTIVLFAIMVGAGPTIVRASIMALLVIIARATGRTYEISRALFIAGFLMVLQNPKILIFDVSFQLSFLATLGLIYLPPLLEHHFHWITPRWQLRNFALATIATQIFVLPLLLFKVGTLSLVALPVNLLVLVFIPITMLLGFLAGVTGFISTLLSIPFAFATYALLTYELGIVELFARIPFASVSVNSFPVLAMLGVYVLYGWVVWRFWRK